MTKTDLIAQVAANTEMSKKSAEMAVNAAFEALGKAMAEGEKISISVFAATCAIRSVLVIIKASTIFSTFSIRADGLTVWYPFTFRPLPASG